MDWSFILKQRGMFSYSGLSKEQVRRLREEYSIYTIDTGRICVAALASKNVDYVADAIAKVIRPLEPQRRDRRGGEVLRQRRLSRRTSARRVAIPTESQNPARGPELRAYLESEMSESLARIGASTRVFDNPARQRRSFPHRRADRDPKRPTVLLYGHGDVIRGQEKRMAHRARSMDGASGGRAHLRARYRRQQGPAHINLAAIEAVLRTRGKLGFNLKVLIETEEETGSPGLKAFCEQHKTLLAADVLIYLPTDRDSHPGARPSISARAARSTSR